MYKMKGCIRYSECQATGKASLPAIINYFQDCTSDNSERSGVGIEYLKEKQRAWVLNSWQVVIKRYPEMSEEIEVSTWATGFKGVFGPRNFCMKTLDGEVLAYANSLWVYVNTENGRPTKPDAEEIAAYHVEPALEMEAVSRKIKLPEDAVRVDTFSVRKYHIDTNNHVNNCQYIQLAAEALPEEFCVSQVRVEYKRAAVYGDEIVMKVAKEENHMIVGLCDTQDNPYAIVEFIGEN